VSDGGAKLDDETRSLITAGLQRNKISLYFIYVQSGINAPDFELVGTDTRARSEEVELHVFFSGLDTDYQVFQADDVTSMGEAVAIIDSQQNLPLTWFERTPGRDYSRLLFIAALASLFLLLTLWQAYLLKKNRNLSAAIQNVPAKITDADPSATESENAHPQVLLSKASALSAGGQFEPAETLLVKLIDKHQSAPVGQAARFNLANHYLREGLREDQPGARTRPLVELAKQRYRDLLLIDPQHWNARYNLELALRVAPEIVAGKEDKRPPVKSVDVIVPDFTLKDLP